MQNITVKSLMISFMSLLLLLTRGYLTGGVRKGVNYVLHTTPRTWNEALSVCATSGGSLATPATSLLHTEFKVIYDYWDGLGNDVMELWIGLYDLNAPDMNFTWTDCCLEEWASWANGEPNKPTVEQCVRLWDGVTWKTRACSVAFPFVCQKHSGGCFFEVVDDTTLDGSLNLMTVGTLTWEACEQHCLNYLSGSDECLAFTLSLMNLCTIHTGKQVYITSLPQTTSSLTTTAVKRCYNYTINTTSTAASDSAAKPNHACAAHKHCPHPHLLPPPPSTSAYDNSYTSDILHSETVAYGISTYNLYSETLAYDTSTDLLYSETVAYDISSDILYSETVAYDTSADILYSETVAYDTSTDILYSETVAYDTSTVILYSETVAYDTSTVTLYSDTVAYDTLTDMINSETQIYLPSNSDAIATDSSPLLLPSMTSDTQYNTVLTSTFDSLYTSDVSLYITDGILYATSDGVDAEAHFTTEDYPYTIGNTQYDTSYIISSSWVFEDVVLSDILSSEAYSLPSTPGTDSSSSPVSLTSTSSSIQTGESSSIHSTPSSIYSTSSLSAMSTPPYTTVPDNTTQETTSSRFRLCRCPCSNQDLDTFVEALYSQRLRVNKREMSKYRRSRTSAEDPRPSARAVGSVLGMGILISICVIFVLLDFSYVINMLFGRETKLYS